MQHQQLFNDKSDLYERARPTYPDAIYQYLATLCDSNSAVWDCACGNGQASVGLATYFNKVYATDISQQQLEQAKQGDNIIYSRSSAEETRFADQSFDLVCVAQALHWFDYSRYWPEVQRLMKPGAVFATWAYNWCTIEADVDQVIQSMVLDVIAPYWAAQNNIVWNEYRDVTFPFSAIEDVPRFTMTVKMNLPQYFDFLHTFSATRRYMDDHGDQFFKRAYAHVEPVWGEPSLLKELHFDLIFYAGVIR